MSKRLAIVFRMHRIGILLCITLFCLTAAPASVHAQHTVAHSVTVLEQTQTIHYPDSITFTLKVRAPGTTFSTAWISIDSDTSSFQGVEQVTPRTSGDTTVFTLDQKLTKYNMPSVGTTVEYHWELKDSANNSERLPSQKFLVFDNRFPWQSKQEGNIQIKWYNQPDEFGHIALQKAKEAEQRICQSLGTSLTEVITIWIYGNRDDFQKSLPPQISEWVGGVTFWGSHEIMMEAEGIGDLNLESTLPHELTHAIEMNMLQEKVRTPSWFDEGLAVYHERFPRPQYQEIFEQAVKENNLIPLVELDTFPEEELQAELAYAQSWQLVSYLYTKYGADKIRAFLNEMRPGDLSFEEALKKTFGVDITQLENEWHLSLNLPATLTPTPTTKVKETPTAEITPTVQVTPQSTPASEVTPEEPLTQPNILIITGGSAIAVAAFLGIVFLLANQHRLKKKREREWFEQQMVSIFTTSETAGPVCPKCGYQNRIGAKFCRLDGEPLSQSGTSGFTPRPDLPYTHPDRYTVQHPPTQEQLDPHLSLPDQH
ncbi:peptidase MA superfamily protein [Thermosporothrix hazakensis]|jgi:hypothetical protein|uniref:Peptidase MA superfamily protein n=1 Tax=Thermosporothrix hazakensis TaxID=644383 RepID=A0A326U4Z7_THEHA|nr:peptidase MA family metallohydrolase [Thermosporothrix hazakensis]PZW26378.1 peptidase MA superfamily protein [Thermosporothrix hazakensis]GCE48670.1 hypothetical protein KTH_35390 [Thermosporothrix hazakensis]